MTTRRKRKKFGTPNVFDSGNLFCSLASVIASAQVPKQPILKSLLYLLGRLSLTKRGNWENCAVLKQVGLINLKDVCYLSNVLFGELDYVCATLYNQNVKTCPTLSSQEAHIELATLLLRCCMKMTLLLSNQKLILEKVRTLLDILGRLIHATNGDGYSVIPLDEGPLDPYHTFLSALLEVFIDEILLNQSMGELLFLVHTKLPRLFSNHHGTVVLGLVSAHFILSTSNEKTSKLFVERLYWKHVSAVRTPQISLCAATSLLLNPLMFSAPKMIHAYVVLLVSDAIGISSPPSVKGLNLQLIDRYIDAFEKSVVLYTKIGVSTSNSRVAFDHLLLPSTLAKVNDVTLKQKESWGLYQSTSAKRGNSELVADSVVYAKESLCLFDSSYSKNILSRALSVLTCVIHRASSDDVLDTVLQGYNTSDFEDLYLLAATLKLMSCSMLEAIRVLRNWHQSEAIGDVRDCKEYKSMMDVVQRFEKFRVHLPGHIPLLDRMKSHPHIHLKSDWMLMHFSDLLSVSFALKLDFLVKDSIFGMVVSLNLFLLEGGDLEAFGNPTCHSESPSSSFPASGFKELATSGKAEETCRKLSWAVALKFHKTRTFFLRKLTDGKDRENGSDMGVGVEEEFCNGESFLRSRHVKSKDVEDLADFVVCETGKDYPAWLKDQEWQRQQWRQRQRQWQRKMALRCGTSKLKLGERTQTLFLQSCHDQTT